jgi:hypothetical protein
MSTITDGIEVSAAALAAIKVILGYVEAHDLGALTTAEAIAKITGQPAVIDAADAAADAAGKQTLDERFP